MQRKTINNRDIDTHWLHTESDYPIAPGLQSEVTLWDGTLEQVETIRDAHRAGTLAFRHEITRSHFVGRPFSTWDDVTKAVGEPWEAGLKMLDKVRDQLSSVELPRPKNIRRQPCWSDEAGDELDLDRYRAREPFWRTSHRARATAPRVVTMAVNIAASCAMSSLAIAWRGATACMMADILEAQGYRVEILAACIMSGVWRNGNSNLQGTWIKKVDERCDIADLINALSGWYFRTVLFGSTGLTGKYAVSHMGMPGKVTKEMVKAIDPATSDECWLIEGAFDFRSAVSLATRLLGTLAEAETVKASTY